MFQWVVPHLIWYSILNLLQEEIQQAKKQLDKKVIAFAYYFGSCSYLTKSLMFGYFPNP